MYSDFLSLVFIYFGREFGHIHGLPSDLTYRQITEDSTYCNCNPDFRCDY